MLWAATSEIKGLEVNEVAGRALEVNRNTAPPTEDQIRQRAYELYVAGGYQAGKDIEHWLQAEAEFTGGALSNS